MLIIICGLPGSGKTTLAEAVSKAVGAEHISSDIVRKKAILKPTYSEQEKSKIYDAMLAMAQDLLVHHEDVIVDATFYKKQVRESFIRIADGCKSPYKVILCELPDAFVKARLQARKKSGRSMSDADYEVHLKVKKEFEPIEQKHLIVQTSKPIKGQVQLVMGFLKK